MSSAKKSSRGRAFRPEFLEPRALRTGGVSAAPSLILDLGAISIPAATRGVEVAATIEAGHSVTFQFQAEIAGYYVLQVRHTGEGLTLEARGPSGSASIDPGPPGPFKTMILPIQGATYQIQADATADEPVFVDWELLLLSGVGQAPALSTVVLGAPGFFPPTGPSASAGAVTPISTPAPPSTPTAAPGPGSGPVCTVSTVGSIGPIGRPTVDRPIASVGPSAPGGSMAMAFNGEGIPSGIAPPRTRPDSDGDAPAAVVAPTMNPKDLELADSDEAVLNDESWWQRVAGSMVRPIRGHESAVDEFGGTIDLEMPGPKAESREMSGLGSDLAVGLIASIAISRRRFFRAGREQPSRWARTGSRADDDRRREDH